MAVRVMAMVMMTIVMEVVVVVVNVIMTDETETGAQKCIKAMKRKSKPRFASSDTTIGLNE